jgi:hypothetical protein
MEILSTGILWSSVRMALLNLLLIEIMFKIEN